MKLALYDSENVLHLTAHGGLAVLNESFPVNSVVRYLRQFLRTAVNTVVDAGKMLIADYFGTLFDAKIAGISVDNFIVIPDQSGCLCYITKPKAKPLNTAAAVHRAEARWFCRYNRRKRNRYFAKMSVSKAVRLFGGVATPPVYGYYIMLIGCRNSHAVD